MCGGGGGAGTGVFPVGCCGTSRTHLLLSAGFASARYVATYFRQAAGQPPFHGQRTVGQYVQWRVGKDVPGAVVDSMTRHGNPHAYPHERLDSRVPCAVLAGYPWCMAAVLPPCGSRAHLRILGAVWSETGACVFVGLGGGGGIDPGNAFKLPLFRSWRAVPVPFSYSAATGLCACVVARAAT